MSRATPAAAVRLAGRGLHTGAPVSLTLRPAPPGTGIVFRRMDVAHRPSLPATLRHVVATDRRIVLEQGGASVATVEHLLASLTAYEIDDVIVELDGPELPAGDGSAMHFAEALRQAGRRSHGGEPRRLAVASTVELRSGDAEYRVEPGRALVLDVTIEWDHPLIGRQSGQWLLSEATFSRELAPARTFGFAGDAQHLSRRGLARGAGTDNVLVLDATGLASGALRFPDEFVRHKALDLLGDLTLLGGRLAATVVAVRPSHRGNVALARALAHHCTATGATCHGHSADPVDPAPSLSPAAGGPDR